MSNMPEVFVNRARSCFELGLVESAYKDLENALDLNPQHEMANALM